MHFDQLTTKASQLHRNSRFDSSLPCLVFMTDCKKISNPGRVVDALGSNTMVIVRDYEHPTREVFARETVLLCQKNKIKVLIAVDDQLALSLKADGVHLPQHKISTAAAIRSLRPHWIITTAVHSEQSLCVANEQPVDAVMLSPIFSTTSHKNCIPLGIDTLTRLTKQSIHPVYALGGVNSGNIDSLSNTQIHGIAAIDAFNCS